MANDDVWLGLYNTELTPEEESQYQKWLSVFATKQRWDTKYADFDYDMRGYWKKNQGNFVGNAETGHLTDEFKKPNHPTFSNQSVYSGVNGNVGGEWSRDKMGKWTFVPSPTNMKMNSVDFMNNYFSKVEPGNTFDIESALKRYSGGR